jgi:hypothetical protein
MLVKTNGITLTDGQTVTTSPMAAEGEFFNRFEPSAVACSVMPMTLKKTLPD